MIDNKKNILMLTISGTIIVFGLAFLLWILYADLPAGGKDNYIIEVSPGMNAGDIANVLYDKGVIRSVFYFKLVSNRHGYSNKFKAGKHVITEPMRTHKIALLLTENPPSPPDIKVTVFEGLNIKETASILANVAEIDSSDFVKLAMDKNTARKLGIDNDTFEGYLYPDTYFIFHDTEPLEMISRMTEKFHSVFDDSLKKRASEIGMSINDIVILASIIETEAQLDEERTLISSVLHKRLKLGRPLEVNVTIQYAIGSKRRVLLEDLDIDSPYNTYTHAGLPPGPIASPGRESIIAALYPADTNYLYFMSNGKGGHVFSISLNEHNRAVQQYKKLRKQSSVN